MTSSSQHNLPAEGSSCLCCWDDLETTTYVEYKSSADSNWLPSGYCNGKYCIDVLTNCYFEVTLMIIATYSTIYLYS